MIDIWQLVSLSGSLFLLTGYVLFILKKINGHGKLFYSLNALGCLLIALSLWFNAFNLGSFVLQVVFFFVSIYGLLKYRHTV